MNTIINKIVYIITFSYLFFININFVKTYKKKGFTVKKIELQKKDTFLLDTFSEVIIFGKVSKQKKRYYSKLEKKVRKVYPFSLEASKLYEKYKKIYDSLGKTRDTKKIMKLAQKELIKKHAPELKKLTISEGRILLVLIDRQIGISSYDLIKEFRGGVQAFFWQGIAKLFKNDLKDRYQPSKRDWAIESIVKQIEYENKFK